MFTLVTWFTIRKTNFMLSLVNREIHVILKNQNQFEQNFQKIHQSQFKVHLNWIFWRHSAANERWEITELHVITWPIFDQNLNPSEICNGETKCPPVSSMIGTYPVNSWRENKHDEVIPQWLSLLNVEYWSADSCALVVVDMRDGRRRGDESIISLLRWRRKSSRCCTFEICVYWTEDTFCVAQSFRRSSFRIHRQWWDNFYRPSSEGFRGSPRRCLISSPSIWRLSWRFRMEGTVVQHSLSIRSIWVCISAPAGDVRFLRDKDILVIDFVYLTHDELHQMLFYELYTYQE